MTKFFLVILLALALIAFAVAGTIQLCVAQPTLSVPEFTLKYADNSYDVPPTTSIDPFTGQNVENPAHHVVNRSLTFIIKNQIIHSETLHFVIGMRGHFSGNWTVIYDGVASESSTSIIWTFSTRDLPGLQEYSLYRGGDSFYLPYTGEADFRIKAQTWGEVMATTSPQNPFGGSITTLFGESDWSDTQTLTIPEAVPHETASPTPTTTLTPVPSNSPSLNLTLSPSTTQQTQPEPTPTQPAQDQSNLLPYVLVVAAAVLVAFVGGALFSRSRYKKSNAQ
jgi:hypothetical protein